MGAVNLIPDGEALPIVSEHCGPSTDCFSSVYRHEVTRDPICQSYRVASLHGYFAAGGAVVGLGPNGIKLASELLLYQLLTQCLPGFDHQREALGPPFLDARLHPMRACGVHNQRP